MTEHDGVQEDNLLHYIKNQLAIILGFADLLLEESPSDDHRRDDIVEIRAAAQATMDKIPELSRRLGGRSTTP